MHSNINPDVTMPGVRSDTMDSDQTLKYFTQSHNLPSPHKDFCVSATFIDQRGLAREAYFHALFLFDLRHAYEFRQ